MKMHLILGIKLCLCILLISMCHRSSLSTTDIISVVSHWNVPKIFSNDSSSIYFNEKKRISSELWLIVKIKDIIFIHNALDFKITPKQELNMLSQV